MTNSEEIIGGVSPLKARQSKRGGKYAGKATKTAKRRGGFAKSKGKRGAGGRNVGGYNVMTRFTPGTPWTPPASGGTSIIPTKPYTPDTTVTVPDIDPLSGTEYKQDPDKVTTIEGERTAYRTNWDSNEGKNKYRDKHETLEDYVKASEDWWDEEAKKANMSKKDFKKQYFTETKTEGGKKWKRTWTQKSGEDKVYSEWEVVG